MPNVITKAIEHYRQCAQNKGQFYQNRLVPMSKDFKCLRLNEGYAKDFYRKIFANIHCKETSGPCFENIILISIHKN